MPTFIFFFFLPSPSSFHVGIFNVGPAEFSRTIPGGRSCSLVSFSLYCGGDFPHLHTIMSALCHPLTSRDLRSRRFLLPPALMGKRAERAVTWRGGGGRSADNQGRWNGARRHSRASAMSCYFTPIGATVAVASVEQVAS